MGLLQLSLPQFYRSSQQKIFLHSVFWGLALGTVAGIGFKMWHRGSYNVRRDDYYKQLRIQQAAERQ